MSKVQPGLVGAVLLLVLAGFLQLLFRDWGVIAANLTSLLGVALLGFVIAGRRPRWKVQRLSLGLVLGALATIVGGSLVLGELANWAQALMPIPPEILVRFQQVLNGPVVPTLIGLSLVAPVTEELLFRGLFLPAFAVRYGVMGGFVFSSALFAAFHGNLWQAPSAFVAGLYLAWLAWSTGSVVVPMVAHALFNAFPVVSARWGWTLAGYNTPLDAHVTHLPVPWIVAGFVLLVLGLAMTKRWAPLSPPTVSDKVNP